MFLTSVCKDLHILEDWRKGETFQQPTALIALSVYVCLERGDVLRTALHLRSEGEPCSKHPKCAINTIGAGGLQCESVHFSIFTLLFFCLDVGFKLLFPPFFPFVLFVCFDKMSWKSVEPRKNNKVDF